MKQTWFTLLFFFLAAANAEPAPTAPSLPSTSENIALSVGRSALWPVSSSGEISVSNGAIVRIVDQGKHIKISALKLGAAVVRSREKTLEINVLPEKTYRLYASLRDSLENRRGLSVSSASGTLKIGGRLLRAEDWMAIASGLQSADADSFSFQATIDPDVEAQIRKELQIRLASAGLTQTNLRFIPEAVATVGAEMKDSKVRAEKILAPFGIRVETNSSVISLEPMVRVKIIVAEIKKSFRRNFGVKWPSGLSGTLLPSVLLPNVPLDIELQALEDRGWGRVLASPTLLCRSGKEAEFMAGGEFPIKLTSFGSSGVTWKNYGVLLKVKPLADSTGRMSIAIETEVSALDEANKVDGIPGLLTNRMQTHFDLSSSRTIALSGLIKNDLSRQTSGLPGLSSIPILGSLFSSTDFKDNQSELVIFVTPAVSRPEDEDSEAHP